METRERVFEFNIETRSDDKNGNHITGMPIVFNARTNLGWYDEIIEEGALDDADLKDVRFLVNHDTSKLPLARSRNNNENSTMQMTVGKDGMSIRVNLDTENNSDARNLYSAVSRGDVTGMSFMFGIDDQEWEELESEHPTRRIKKISRVLEVSAVTFPAYEQTEISARDKASLEEARAALESARKSALDSEKAEELKVRKRKMLELKIKLAKF